MERGSLADASECVLEALADALRLDQAERAHLFALARESGARSGRGRPRSGPEDRATEAVAAGGQPGAPRHRA